MIYLKETDEIKRAIEYFSGCRVLWLDTETADHDTKNPRLSLIQILEDSTDLKGDKVTILDLLDRSALIQEFIDKIMMASHVEKVFHNANYDCRFLGGRKKVENVTCTLELAKKIPYYIAPLPDYQLKTLAEELCHFPFVDKSERLTDWGQRPLTEQQLEYAKKDPVYTAQVHHRLLQLCQSIEPPAEKDNIPRLTRRYREIYRDWKILDSEKENLEKRLKKAMLAQNVGGDNGINLGSQNRRDRKVSLTALARLVYETNFETELAISLTNGMLEELAALVPDLPIEEVVKKIYVLKMGGADDDGDTIDF